MLNDRPIGCVGLINLGNRVVSAGGMVRLQGWGWTVVSMATASTTMVSIATASTRPHIAIASTKAVLSASCRPVELWRQQVRSQMYQSVLAGATGFLEFLYAPHPHHSAAQVHIIYDAMLVIMPYCLL